MVIQKWLFERKREEKKKKKSSEPGGERNEGRVGFRKLN
jgi:hypothetical protein